jgi:transcriptional regulator with XRE-family HTH domain
MRRTADESFQEVVPALLRERGWTQKDLARRACVDPGFLCRVLGNQCRVSFELASRVADAFDLPPCHFPEYRELEVIRAIRDDPALRDRLYARLRPTASQR